MSVQYLDPRADTATPVKPYDLSLDLHDQAVEIGLLANGFPDSVVFLDQVEAALTASLPRASFHRYDKGNASTIASAELLDVIAAECGALVAAYGH